MHVNRAPYLQDLIGEVKELERGLTEKKWHLEREQETTKLYQSKHYDVQVKLKKMEEMIVRLSKPCSLDLVIDCVRSVPTALFQY